VSTVVLAIDGMGQTQFFADYRQWEEAQRRRAFTEPRTAAATASAKPVVSGPKRLSYAKRREWEQMEATILTAEQALAACRAAVDDPSIAADATALQQRYAELQAAQERVDQLYARWAELEAEQL